MNTISTTQTLRALAPAAGKPAAVPRNGNSLPTAGNIPPPGAVPAPVETAVNQLNYFLGESGQKLRFSITWASGQPVIKAVNLDSGQVQTMPADEVLRMAAALARDGRHTFETLA